jgi:hypothetical protein
MLELLRNTLAMLLRPGYQVVIALAVLALVVLFAGVVVWRVDRRRALRAAAPVAVPAPEAALRREPVLQHDPALAVAGRPSVGRQAADSVAEDASLKLLDQSLSALQMSQSLAQRLSDRLARQRQSADKVRGEAEAAAQLLRETALALRLPDTAFELYESLRRLPAKAAQVQRADREWHALARIESPRATPLDESLGLWGVEFMAAGQFFRIVGQTYRLSRADFDELTVFGAGDAALMTVRVTLDAARTQVVKTAVMAYRPGAWVEVWVKTRALMDERQQSLLMRSRYRDVETMCNDFGLKMPLDLSGAGS